MERPEIKETEQDKKKQLEEAMAEHHTGKSIDFKLIKKQ